MQLLPKPGVAQDIGYRQPHHDVIVSVTRNVAVLTRDKARSRMSEPALATLSRVPRLERIKALGAQLIFF